MAKIELKKMKTDHCTPCEFNNDLGKSVLNSLSAHIAIINAQGVIVETNRAWQNFAASTDIEHSYRFIGVNYLDVCDNAQGDDAVDARAVANGIRSVINNEVTEFLYDYPCYAPDGKHWFYMRAIGMGPKKERLVIVSHEEITQLKLTEEALTKSKNDLEKQKQDLEETNIALKVLLKQREEDKSELEQQFLINIKEMVLPYIEKLKRAPLRPKDKNNLSIIENHLNDIISPMLQRLSNINIVLTPQEMQVAVLVKDGRSSKEIAEILNVSETTIHFHRKNLRQKLGIRKSATNLRTYLMSIT